MAHLKLKTQNSQYKDDLTLVREVAVKALKEIAEWEMDSFFGEYVCTGECANISDVIKKGLDKYNIRSVFIDVRNQKLKGVVGNDHTALLLKPHWGLIIDTQVWQFTNHDYISEKPISTRKIIFTQEEYEELGFVWKETFGKGGTTNEFTYTIGGL